MKKYIAVLLVVVSMVSCKTAQKAVVSEGAAGEEKAVKEIVDGHYKNVKDFKTVLIKASVGYKDKRTKQNVNAEIRIKKDEIILVSVRALGFNLAKAIITPTRVSYYEKLGSTYFDGDYAALSKWLGTELDYAKVQNMLLGNAIYDLKQGKYAATLEGGQHVLKSMDRSAISKLFFFEGENFLLKKEIISRAGQEPTSLDIQYPAYKQHSKAMLPAAIKIEAEQNDVVNIDVEYNTVTFDENLTFPYEVPEGYNQIFID
ncbi:DUF4292 domain-containing protein [Flavobacterium sp. DG1-102-2]|uniref:DUF4292 domain-containing protein n=1 Tax=Flavobacterium sp. DG1-102-2 TaxID=3081663 RepID=UPI0029490F43|nr:DUF4292 domain-containing protein [Flavobacterium sp. DG1-102-2]MDV6167695.1 DUF4292 domain-containing protein [Flavobacterium sp. DG1-102-2]